MLECQVGVPHTDGGQETKLSLTQRELQYPKSAGEIPGELSSSALLGVTQGDRLVDVCIRDTLRWLMDSESITIPDDSVYRWNRTAKKTKTIADKVSS